MNIDLEKIKKVYLIGIKGSGLIAFAEIFHAMGKEVIGSDTEEIFFTDETLKKLGIRYFEGFSKDNIKNELPIDLVLYSTAYSEQNNEELKFAKENDILSLSYPEMIGELMKAKYSVAVCGTHGKTTTTAMLALAMRDAEMDPTAIIGSKIKQLKSNTLLGKSEYFIVEADEYQDKLSLYHPMGVVLTSLDYDHPDFFSSFEDYKEVFRKFIRKIPAHGFLVVWGENPNTLEIAKEAQCRIIVYGAFRNETVSRVETPGESINEAAIEQIRAEFKQAGKSDVKVVVMPPDYELDLKVPGRHNLLDATAVLAVCAQFRINEQIVRDSLENFEGTARRFEVLGEHNKAVIVDDYAHHPEEIRATLAATKEKYPGRNIFCVFHPHTFSRTKALLSEFSRSFDDADEVIVLDIYGSAREKQGDVSSKDLVEKIKETGKNARHITTIEKAYEYLRKKIGSQDVVITMGAGDVFKLGKKLVGRYR